MKPAAAAVLAVLLSIFLLAATRRRPEQVRAFAAGERSPATARPQGGRLQQEVAVPLGLVPSQSTWTLPQILDRLTAAAPQIHSLEATAAVVDYTALVDEADHSSGKLYFERSANGPRYVLDLTQPQATAKKLLYTDHTAYVYTPSARQVMKYPLGNNPQELNQYLLLGMGATGADLTRAFAVALDGPAKLNGKETVELTLTPRSDKLKSKLTRLDIWYNPRTWIGVQQKIWQPGGDYHLLTLSAIELNAKLSDALFSTAFPGATVITPHF